MGPPIQSQAKFAYTTGREMLAAAAALRHSSNGAFSGLGLFGVGMGIIS